MYIFALVPTFSSTWLRNACYAGCQGMDLLRDLHGADVASVKKQKKNKVKQTNKQKKQMKILEIILF